MFLFSARLPLSSATRGGYCAVLFLGFLKASRLGEEYWTLKLIWSTPGSSDILVRAPEVHGASHTFLPRHLTLFSLSVQFHTLIFSTFPFPIFLTFLKSVIAWQVRGGGFPLWLGFQESVSIFFFKKGVWNPPRKPWGLNVAAPDYLSSLATFVIAPFPVPPFHCGQLDFTQYDYNIAQYPEFIQCAKFRKQWIKTVKLNHKQLAFKNTILGKEPLFLEVGGGERGHRFMQYIVWRIKFLAWRSGSTLPFISSISRVIYANPTTLQNILSIPCIHLM